MLYLKLFHGRKDPNEQMDDWGTDGSIFGPYHFIHTVYGSHLYQGKHRCESVQLWLHDDMVGYNGVYYGDWSVFTEDLLPHENPSRLQPFDPAKAPLPGKDAAVKPSLAEKPVKIIVTIRGGVCQEVKTNLPDDCWEYALVDHDNEPDLPDNYPPYKTSEMNIVPVIPQANRLLKVARSIISNWKNGDLAQAVRELGKIITEI